MRWWLRAAAASVLALPAPLSAADEVTVSAAPIATFQGKPIGERVGGLVWRGGLDLTSAADNFGGLSGLTFTGPEGRLVMVSDQGRFVSGQLIHDDDGRPLGLVGVAITPIQNSKGADLPRAFARDAEAVHVIMRDGVPAAVRVGFENLTRVADFRLVEGVPTGPAREVSVPAELSAMRNNESLEAVCVAPPASPVAGSTLLLTEAISSESEMHAAWLLGSNDKGPLGLTVTPGVNPTDCAFLPNGDLLVLERGVGFLSFTMALLRVPAAEVHAGSLLQGEILLSGSGEDIDNMEAMSVYTAPDGETRIVLVSDDNFNDWERTLLLEFGLSAN